MSLKYRITAIGWYNFEGLVQTLLRELIGPGLMSFGGSKDAGRDATFRGEANFPSSRERWTGYWVFQVKYVDLEAAGESAARAQLKTTLLKEIKNIVEKKRRCDNYVLITNVPMTSGFRDDLRQRVADLDICENFAAIDGKEICEFLDLYPHVRRSFPQLLGLADLESIVNHDLITRSRAYVEQWQPRLSTYVQTDAHVTCLRLLRKTHFVVLDGPPEAGKSAIAAAISITFASEGYQIIDVRESNNIFKAFSGEQRQLFIADDVVGSVALDPARADSWRVAILPGSSADSMRNMY